MFDPTQDANYREILNEDPTLDWKNPVDSIYIQLRLMGYTKKEADSAIINVGHRAELHVHIDHIEAFRTSLACDVAAATKKTGASGSGVGHSGAGADGRCKGVWDEGGCSRKAPECDASWSGWGGNPSSSGWVGGSWGDSGVVSKKATAAAAVQVLSAEPAPPECVEYPQVGCSTKAPECDAVCASSWSGSDGNHRSSGWVGGSWGDSGWVGGSWGESGSVRKKTTAESAPPEEQDGKEAMKITWNHWPI